MDYYKLNERIKIIGKNVKGTIAFIGATHFTDGILFGVVMDEAKGRHNGIVDGIRYFKCPKDQGIFVRACQLEKENADSDGSVKNGKVARSMYPNYLKYSSKLTLEKSVYGKKSKEHGPKTSSADIQQELNINHSPLKSNSLSLEKFHCSTEVSETDNTSRFQIHNEENLLFETTMKLRSTLEELAAKENEINWLNNQITTVQGCVNKLKTCLRWSRKCDDNYSAKDNRIKSFLSHVIDSTIRNMEETIKAVEAKHFDYTVGDNGLKAENCFLLQHILDLEKQTEILLETMLQIRSIIIKQSKKRRSRSKYHCDSLRKPSVKLEKIKNDCGYSSKSLSDAEVTDFQRHSTTVSSKLDSKGYIYSESVKDGIEKLQMDAGNCCGEGEKLSYKKSPLSLEPVQDTGNKMCSISTKNFQAACDLAINSESHKSEEPRNGPILSALQRKTNRFTPYSLNFRRTPQEGVGDKNENSIDDVTKELQEFISDIMAIAEQPTSSESNINEAINRPVKEIAEDKFHSDSDKTTVVSIPSSRGKYRKYLSTTKKRLPARRRKVLKKKAYSVRISKP